MSACRGGFYCTNCGTCYTTPGSGLITCQRCGHLGLRGFNKRPRHVACSEPGCTWVGWDDGGVNDDIGRHIRRDHGASGVSL